MIIALKEIRRQAGIEVEELSEKTGISKTALWGYESGRRSPDPETLCVIADALDVSLDMLVRGKEKDPTGKVSVESLLKMYKGMSEEQLSYFIAVMQAALADKRFQAHLGQGL